MLPCREACVETAGAHIFYRSVGQGPVLLFIQGGDGDADGCQPLVEALAEHYRVITYDPRGLSRSRLARPPEALQLATHADDAWHVLRACTDQPALVFGTSRGALVGLDLVARYGRDICMLVAHEPPVPSLLPPTEQNEVAARQRAIDAAYAHEGAASAMLFLAGMLQIDFADREPGNAPPGAGVDRISNMRFFLDYDEPAIRRYQLDLAGLKRVSSRIVPAAGKNTPTAFTYRCTAILAGHLNEPLVEFPGGHAGPSTHPRGFAERLLTVLGENE